MVIREIRGLLSCEEGDPFAERALPADAPPFIETVPFVVPILSENPKTHLYDVYLTFPRPWRFFRSRRGWLRPRGNSGNTCRDSAYRRGSVAFFGAGGPLRCA